MKTPDEIKKGLEYCAGLACNCDICPYQGCNVAGRHPACDIEMGADALAYIQQLEAQALQWISVEERLPEYGRYLVVTQKGNAGPKAHTATYNHMGWWTHADFGEITHWMPLPEPPKEE